MASTTFVNQQTIIDASWLNDVNTATYTTVPANTAAIATKASSGANSDITSITGLTTPLAVTQGGTAATTAAGARTALGLSIGTDVASGGAVTTSGLTQATNRLLGRTTASTGAIEEISVGNGLTLSSGSLAANAVNQIQPISASVASNALTISAGSLTLDFRSTTLGSGTVTQVTGTPANLVISSGSTLGTTNAVQSDIAVLAINNAGTIELAAVNISGGVDLSETGLISTTAEGGVGGADSATTIYSTTARTSVAYRVIGIIRSTQATAGTWATAPSLVQGQGGNALTAMMSLGYGQTKQDVTSSRAIGTTYYNTTGKPIEANVAMTSNVACSVYIDVTQAGVTTRNWGAAGGIGAIMGVKAIVPVGAAYVANVQAGTGALTANGWIETR